MVDARSALTRAGARRRGAAAEAVFDERTAEKALATG